MISYIDTHVHLDLLDDINKAIKYIDANQIYVIAMTNHPKVYETLFKKIDSKYIRVALGMHPELINNVNMALFKKYVNSTKYIGEIGLDFSKRNNHQEQQKAIFNEILSLSRKKILSIHSRKAESDVLNSIEQNYNKDSIYILHWYSGGIKDMQRAIDLGCYFSINLNMVISKKFCDYYNLLPINKILIESDAPFSKGNIYNISSTYYKLSKAFSMDEESIKAQVFNNFKELLKMSNR